jgi:cell division protein FtsN
MSDGSFREIQLTAKQVVFLFMAGLVAAVGIFLLGVQVGQRVSPDAPPAEATSAADSADGAPDVMPPATTPRPGELTAPNDLQNRPVPTVTATPTPAPPPAAAPTTTSPTPTPTSKPASTPEPEKTPAARPEPAGTHFVQVGLFSSRDNAQRQLTQLKAKGHTAELIVGPASDRARYRVRIGPLPERAARDLQAQLRKEGMQSLVVPR